MGTVIGSKGMNVKLQIRIGIEVVSLTEEKLSTKSMETVKIVTCNVDYHIIGKNNINRNFIS